MSTRHQGFIDIDAKLQPVGNAPTGAVTSVAADEGTGSDDLVPEHRHHHCSHGWLHNPCLWILAGVGLTLAAQLAIRAFSRKSA